MKVGGIAVLVGTHGCTIGQWENEEAIDAIVDSITSPDGLNMNIFRYNIGGGDDPSHLTTETTAGHMSWGRVYGLKCQALKQVNNSFNI